MKSHSVLCKQWLIDNGYAKSMAELINVDVCDDGKVYWSLFRWVSTGIRL